LCTMAPLWHFVPSDPGSVPHRELFFFFGILRQVSLCSSGWPLMCDSPSSASWMQGLQVWTTIPAWSMFFTNENIWK
jgi:hypothetical protein